MTLRELPRWMRIWIVTVFVILVVAVTACVVMGIITNIDSRNAA